MSAAEAGRQAMRGRGLVLGTLCLAALILNLDTTIVNVALPALVRQFGATTSGLQWVVDAYNLVFAASVLAAGSTADRLGRKLMLLAGLGVFGAASLAGALAATTGELNAARAVMGLGAAMVFPATLSLLTGVFTERRARAAAIGLWGASAGVGVGVGPIAGGWLAVPLGNKVIVGGGIGLVCAALVWISTASQATSYGIIAAQMVVFGIGMGMTQSPATEAIMGAVPEEKGGIASAVNGCTRLFGGTRYHAIRVELKAAQ